MDGNGQPSIPRPSLSSYYNASRLRTDAWDRLKTATRHLAQTTLQGGGGSELRREVAGLLATLEPLEGYWAFPGRRVLRELKRRVESREYDLLAREVAHVVRLLVSHAYRNRAPGASPWPEPGEEEADDGLERGAEGAPESRPYFEVLVVDDIPPREVEALRERLGALRRPEDEFVYDVVVVPSFEDALIAVLLNYHVQSCVIRYGFPFESRNRFGFLQRTLEDLDRATIERMDDGEVGLVLARSIKSLRPTLDLYLVTDAPVEDVAGKLGRAYRRVFYRQEDYRELHQSILKGIRERYATPFFSALRSYSQKPTGVFHALPISRGKSISKSHWIRDMEDFYGTNVFLAETSATGGGLDSLLQPHGPLREAQEAAARAFGARRSYFVTNGTSTANKIVLQALLRPGDIVLASRDCHKSHHYSLVLTGCYPVYMDPYPLGAWSMYGAVPLVEIKRQLLQLKREGKLDRVRMLLLTSCTFDGIVYNPERVMEEVLAIKPDMVFVWDEAWFAFAYFTPITRRRTGMEAANRLRERLKSDEYRKRYARWKAEFDRKPDDDRRWLEGKLMAPPAALVRVYATQSTHKTLTSLRQGSMIHVNDSEFERRTSEAFKEAYMTHTCTSPNYQILASLDVGRRQVELEGYELVQHAIELALTLRDRVNSHPLLARYFRVLTPRDLVPEAYRPSGFRTYRDVRTDWARLDQAWDQDEFCLDPTRLTLAIGLTGIEGEAFKKLLLEHHDIQVNKTTRNTVLFMTHIGTTRGAMAYLIEVLTRLAEELEEKRGDEGARERRAREESVTALTQQLPPLPDFSRFHRAFRPHPEGLTPEGDLRQAFFLAADDEQVEHLRLDGSVQRALESGREVVAAAFITPYPPGFPVLVPGQVVSPEILQFLRALDVKEIHGYDHRHGLRVFREETLERELVARGLVVRAPAPAAPDPHEEPAPARRLAPIDLEQEVR